MRRSPTPLPAPFPTWSRIGWRNLARNRRRTAITVSGLAAGYFAVVFLVGWVGGLTDELIENATSLTSGQIEIHHPGYRPERRIHDTIGGREGVEVDTVLREVESEPMVTAAAPRVFAGGLVSSGDSTSAGVLVGVDPERETRVSRFLARLAGGRLPLAGGKELVIGEEMARQLGVGVGDELVLVAPAADGSTANDLFELVGLFRTGLVDVDTTLAVTTVHDLQEFAVLHPGRIHEIAVATADPGRADEAARRLADRFGGSGPALGIASWTELHPVIVDYVALVDGTYWIIVVIVFTVALFGVANTMLIATFERRREFAVLLAMGAAPRSIMGIVLSESFAAGVLSLALGTSFALPLMVWWHNAPPDLAWLYGETSLGGVLLTPSLRIAYNVPAWISASGALLLTALLAAVYPAFRAARIPPADTLAGR